MESLIVVAAVWCPHSCLVPRTTDTTGAHWEQQSGPFGWLSRFASALLSLPDGDVLMVGGLTHDDSDAIVFATDAWRTSNGAQWWSVTATEVPPRSHAGSVVLPSGSILLAGGVDDGGVTNSVWRSDGPQVGSRWYLVTAAAAWPRRERFGMVVLPGGTVVVAGGMSNEGAALDDVWASTNEGVDWHVVVEHAQWGPRFDFSFSALADGAMLVVGGTTGDESGDIDDTWRSDDGGETFFQLPARLPGGPAAQMQAVVRGQSVLLVGAGASGAPVHRSTDGGYTWHSLTNDGGWTPRSEMRAAVLGDGSVMMLGGRVTPGDVYISSASGNPVWRTDVCLARKRALCTAPRGSTSVTVDLPAHAGSITPPNSAAPRAASWVYAPPVPQLNLDDEASTTGDGFVASSTLAFNVAFPSPVVGLAATDFLVWTDEAPVRAQWLTGAAQGWVLTVSLDISNMASIQCPSGYRLSPDASLCGAAIETADTWAAQQDACWPYSLAIVTTPQDADFLASLRDWASESYW